MNSQSLSLELQCPPLQKAASRPEDDNINTLNASTSSPSPSSPAARSPSEPLMPSDAESFDAAKDPSSGPQRSKLSPSGKGGKEKRKRSRVNPEQLVHLERFFLADRSPTAIRRKEISEILGMQERQTQIWFQNRRAKAKLQDGRPKNNDHVDPSSLDTTSHLASGHHLNIQSLIHEDEAVTIIPCTDLSVGSWRRVASSNNSRDLIAYICEAKQCLTWFIHSVGYGFKMEIDFDTIIDTEFNGATMGSGMISLMLSQPPLFYLESTTPPLGDGSVKRYWKQCADWTEGHQATQVLRHELIGPAPQLAHLFTRLRSWTTGPRAGQLSSPFSVSSLASPLTPIDQQPLYPTDLTSHRRGSDMDHPGFSSKTHFNPSLSSYAKSLLEPTPQSAPRLRSAPPSAPQTPLSAQVSPSLFSDFSGLDEPQHTLNVSEYRRASAPTVYGASRSYMTQPLAQPVPLSLYQQPRSLSQFPSLQTPHMNYANTSSSPLNPSFLPQPDLASSGQAQPMLSGLVGYPYETDDNTYSQGSFLGLNPCTTKEIFAEDTTIGP